MVLKDLELYDEMLTKCEEINVVYVNQLQLAKAKEDNFKFIIANDNEQIKLLKEQLKIKKGGSWLVPTLIGFAGGVILGVSL